MHGFMPIRQGGALARSLSQPARLWIERSRPPCARIGVAFVEGMAAWSCESQTSRRSGGWSVAPSAAAVPPATTAPGTSDGSISTSGNTVVTSPAASRAAGKDAGVWPVVLDDPEAHNVHRHAPLQASQEMSPADL